MNSKHSELIVFVWLSWSCHDRHRQSTMRSRAALATTTTTLDATTVELPAPPLAATALGAIAETLALICSSAGHRREGRQYHFGPSSSIFLQDLDQRPRDESHCGRLSFAMLLYVN